MAAAVAAAGADPHQRAVGGVVDGGLPDAGLVAVTALLSAPARAAEGFFKRYSVSVNNMLCLVLPVSRESLLNPISFDFLLFYVNVIMPNFRPIGSAKL